jgi:hypothetical protein
VQNVFNDRFEAITSLAGKSCPHQPPQEGYMVDTKTGEERGPVLRAVPATQCPDCIAGAERALKAAKTIDSLQKANERLQEQLDAAEERATKMAMRQETMAQVLQDHADVINALSNRVGMIMDQLEGAE